MANKMLTEVTMGRINKVRDWFSHGLWSVVITTDQIVIGFGIPVSLGYAEQFGMDSAILKDSASTLRGLLHEGFLRGGIDAKVYSSRQEVEFSVDDETKFYIRSVEKGGILLNLRIKKLGKGDLYLEPGDIVELFEVFGNLK